VSRLLTIRATRLAVGPKAQDLGNAGRLIAASLGSQTTLETRM